jgi:penicillin-binding protein 1A
VAYAVFANGGYKVEPQLLRSIKTTSGETLYENEFIYSNERVLSENSSKLMNAMLERALNAGTGASLRGRYEVTLPLAAKTGTSQDYADAWFAAYNPTLVMASRVGASSPAIHFNSSNYGTGSALALPLVALTLKKAQEDPELVKNINTDFPELSYELSALLDCPDYSEETLMDIILDIFQDKPVYEKDIERFKKERVPLLRRLFRKNRR